VDMRRVPVAIAPVLLLALVAGCDGSMPRVAPTTVPPPGGSRVTVTPTTGPTTTTMPPKISGFLAQSASFVSADDGYVLGVDPCPTGACLALRHTTNRSASWTTIPPPATTLDLSGSGVSELHFADALNGWAFGPALWVTHDGGRDWHDIDIGGPVVAMASGAGIGFALVEACVPSSSCTALAHLYRSPVGQDSWAQVPGVSGRFDEGSFSLVVEGRTVFVLNANPSAQILASSDGLHFAPLPVPCSPQTMGEAGPFVPASLAASDPSDVAVACLGGAGTGNQFKQAYVSHDGGHTYQKLTDPPTAGGGAELVMPSPTTILLGSSSAASMVYRVASANGSWTTPLIFGNDGVELSDLAFVDPSHGAVVDGPANIALRLLSFANPPSSLGTLYLTDDGGTDWHLVHVPT